MAVAADARMTRRFAAVKSPRDPDDLSLLYRRFRAMPAATLRQPLRAQLAAVDQRQRDSRRAIRVARASRRCSSSSRAPPDAERPRAHLSRSSSRAGRRKSIDARDREHDAVVVGEAAVVEAQRAQQLGPPALGKAQVVGVVDDAGRRRCPRSRRAAASGARQRSWRAPRRTGRPAVPTRTGRVEAQMRARPARVSSRPRGVRCNRPCCSRNGSTVSSSVSRCSARAAAMRVDPDRAAAVVLAIGAQVAAVQAVEARDRRPPAGAGCDRPACASTGRPSPSTVAKSRTRRSSRVATRGVPRARRAISCAPSGSKLQPQQAGAAQHDVLELGHLVELEPGDDAEPVAQRRGQQARRAWWRRPA